MKPKKCQILTDEGSLFPETTAYPAKLISFIQSFKRNVSNDMNLLNIEEKKLQIKKIPRTKLGVNKAIIQLDGKRILNKKIFNIQTSKTYNNKNSKDMKMNKIYLPKIKTSMSNNNYFDIPSRKANEINISNKSIFDDIPRKSCFKNKLITEPLSPINKQCTSDTNILFITSSKNSKNDLHYNERNKEPMENYNKETIETNNINDEDSSDENKLNTEMRTLPINQATIDEKIKDKIIRSQDRSVTLTQVSNISNSKLDNCKVIYNKFNSKKFKKTRKIICSQLKEIETSLNDSNDQLIFGSKDYSAHKKFMLDRCNKYLKRFDNKLMVDTDEYIDKENIDKKKYSITKKLDDFVRMYKKSDKCRIQDILKELQENDLKKKNDDRERQNIQHKKIVSLLNKSGRAMNELLFNEKVYSNYQNEICLSS